MSVAEFWQSNWYISSKHINGWKLEVDFLERPSWPWKWELPVYARTTREFQSSSTKNVVLTGKTLVITLQINCISAIQKFVNEGCYIINVPILRKEGYYIIKPFVVANPKRFSPLLSSGLWWCKMISSYDPIMIVMILLMLMMRVMQLRPNSGYR